MSVARTRSASSKQSIHDIPPPPPPLRPLKTPQWEGRLEATAASASFFLYAQRNVILCLHHDSLAIERRFELHKEDVLWIVIDNWSDRGAGRLVVSYDVAQIAIVWDLLTGDEVARFESFEELRCAAWMKNGNVAFGNSAGNIILFETSTKEHLSTKTIYDPVTALAPAADNHTFAIGYQNGTILIVRLLPKFDILHTPHSRMQSPLSITGLAWHGLGSSAKQKSDMLASQSAEGDILIWSVPKVAIGGEVPIVIRDLGSFQGRGPSPCWFGWSKTGRIVQFQEGRTCTHDVRTKKVETLQVPTIADIIGMSNYGPTATVFTVGPSHTVQQYDVNPNGKPDLVASCHHIIPNLPPSPPNSIEEEKKKREEERQRISAVSGTSMPLFLDVTTGSDDEGAMGRSPLQKIAQEADFLDMEELRDQVPPLESPVSSKSSISTRSSGRRTGSGGSGGSRSHPRERYKPAPSMYSNVSAARSEATTFSGACSMLGGSQVGGSQASVSTRSASSAASSRRGGSRLRNQVLPSPEEAQDQQMLDIFPFAKARLLDTPFINAKYEGLSVDGLRIQMLSIVFGWDDDIEPLIRDEHARHRPGSGSSVLLSKWLGNSEADLGAAMVGSQTMTSSDWMLLALSSLGNSQRQVAETFVQALLQKSQIHAAVSVLIGLGEHSDAIEVYVSQKYYLEATLLTCFIFPRDWQRISFLVRKMGEAAMAESKAELAVRCFSCTSMEASEAYLSPRAQDAAYAAQQQHIMGSISPPLSPPDSSMGGMSRTRQRMAGLSLITNFAQQQAAMDAAGVTPIAESAGPSHLRATRFDSATTSARTATPSGYARQRLPSSSATERVPTSDATPLAVKAPSAFPETPTRCGRSDARSNRSLNSAASMSSDRLLRTDRENTVSPMAHKGSDSHHSKAVLPSPAHGIFDGYQARTRSRHESRTRKPDSLYLDMHERVVEVGPDTGVTGYQTSTTETSSVSRMTGERTHESLAEINSPPLTGASMASTKVRAIDNYISSLGEAKFYHQQQLVHDKERTLSHSRNDSRGRRGTSEVRARSPQGRGRSNVRYINKSQRSPSSPVSMSPDDPALKLANEIFDDHNFYRVTSPINAIGRSGSKQGRSTPKNRSSSMHSKNRAASPGSTRAGRSTSKAKSKVASHRASPERAPMSATRGRSAHREDVPRPRSPTSPQSMSAHTMTFRVEEDLIRPHFSGSGESGEEGIERVPSSARQRSTSRRTTARSGSTRREGSPDLHRVRDRSTSRRPLRDAIPEMSEDDSPTPVRPSSTSTRTASRSRMPRLQTNLSSGSVMSQKERAAKELEERRLSLARRPSAPAIPHPDEIEKSRSPICAMRTRTPLLTDALGTSRSMTHSPLSAIGDRGHRPELSASSVSSLPTSVTGTSTSSVPMGLPATPRAMRLPKYMGGDSKDGEDIPAIPEEPSVFVKENVAKEAKEAEDVLPLLLPATTYSPFNTPRSASVPSEQLFENAHRRLGSLGGDSVNRGHVRKVSGGSALASLAQNMPTIDSAIADAKKTIVEEPAEELEPPLLPELQHLAGPPPPPPPPPPPARAPFLRSHTAPGATFTLGGPEGTPLDRNGTPIAMTSTGSQPASCGASPIPAASPLSHRRGRGSVSETAANKLRSVRDRMRSTSRNRVRDDNLTSFTPNPYESVRPPATYAAAPRHTRVDSLGKTGSPTMQQVPAYERILPPGSVSTTQAGAAAGTGTGELEQGRSASNTPLQGYRNPRDVRANMPPEQLQQGVYTG